MLFVLGDNRIFGFDYEAYKLLEIDMSLLDGKIQTTVEVFSQIDCIAFGGSLDDAIARNLVLSFSLELRRRRDNQNLEYYSMAALFQAHRRSFKANPQNAKSSCSSFSLFCRKCKRC
jgi:hypothetical protein